MRPERGVRVGYFRRRRYVRSDFMHRQTRRVVMRSVKAIVFRWKE